jgi:hypothetical protein
MDAEGRIVDLALSFDGWVFGGYVRDTVIRKEKASDIDICFPHDAPMHMFMRILNQDHEVEIVSDRTHPDGLYMSQGIRRLVKVIVDEKIHLDLCKYEGSFEDWRREESTDFTCNLFYVSRDTALGLRYIPKAYKLLANPIKHLVDMTKRKEFVRIWGDENLTFKNTCTILSRTLSRVKRGWYLINDTVNTKMAHVMDETENRLWDIVNEIDHLVEEMEEDETPMQGNPDGIIH